MGFSWDFHGIFQKVSPWSPGGPMLHLSPSWRILRALCESGEDLVGRCSWQCFGPFGEERNIKCWTDIYHCLVLINLSC